MNATHRGMGTPHGSRRRLAQKLGVEFAEEDEFRKRVMEMRERGMMRKEIAREIRGVNLCVVKRYVKEGREAGNDEIGNPKSEPMTKAE